MSDLFMYTNLGFSETLIKLEILPTYCKGFKS